MAELRIFLRFMEAAFYTQALIYKNTGTRGPVLLIMYYLRGDGRGSVHGNATEDLAPPIMQRGIVQGGLIGSPPPPFGL